MLIIQLLQRGGSTQSRTIILAFIAINLWINLSIEFAMFPSDALGICVYVYIYIHTRTHTHTCLYTYICICIPLLLLMYLLLPAKGDTTVTPGPPTARSCLCIASSSHCCIALSLSLPTQPFKYGVGKARKFPASFLSHVTQELLIA